MKKLTSFVVCIVFAFALVFGGGKVVHAQEGQSVSQAVYNFNTESIIVLDGEGAQQAFEDIKDEFDLIEQTFSLNFDSEIKRLNKQGYLL
ncbi:MAG: hypothetical protein IJV77_04830, partial [Clostridia bacterium]|nr:hypothetical protein [Clostridia bacterium]